MKTSFTQLRDTAYQMHIEIPYTKTELMEELRSQDWQPDGDYSAENTLRFRLNDISGSKMLSEIHDHIMSQEFKFSIYDVMYSNETFKNSWGIPRYLMDYRTTTFCSFILDKPKFYSPMHIDQRGLVVSGMVYFIEDDETDKVTTFYTDKEKSNPIAVKPGFGQGWATGNASDTWHDGGNFGTTDRYCILYGMTLNFFNA